MPPRWRRRWSASRPWLGWRAAGLFARGGCSWPRERALSTRKWPDPARRVRNGMALTLCRLTNGPPRGAPYYNTGCRMARGVRKDADCDDPYGKPTEYIHDGGQPLRGTPPDAPAVVPNDKEVENRVGPLAQTAHEGASQDSNTWSYHHVPRALGTLESVNSCPEPVPPNSVPSARGHSRSKLLSLPLAETRLVADACHSNEATHRGCSRPTPF